jgi:protein-arginine kinase activator protein McsA
MREICERCKKKPAKNFVCQITDGQKKTFALCDDCFRADSAASGQPMFDGTERCYYCDAPAKTGRANDDCEQLARGERFHFTCLRCSQLYVGFIVPALVGIPGDLSADAQMDAYVNAVSESDRLVHATLRD